MVDAEVLESSIAPHGLSCPSMIETRQRRSHSCWLEMCRTRFRLRHVGEFDPVVAESFVMTGQSDQGLVELIGTAGGVMLSRGRLVESITVSAGARLSRPIPSST